MKKVILFLILCINIISFAKATDLIKIACVGNSITYGTGIKDRIHHSYPAQLQLLLGEKYLVKNFGKPGTTLLSKGHRPYIAQEEYKQALDYKADIVIIHLGINDTDPRNWSNHRDEFVSDYLKLINSFKQSNPKSRIIIARITPIADRHHRFISGTQQWHAEIQQAIQSVAAISQVELIDFHSPLYRFPILLPDSVHPNEEGAGIMARTAYSMITGDYGGLQVPKIYTDYMVLQRDTTICIHGSADAQTPIKVSIDTQTKKTITKNNGQWSIVLDPIKVGNDYTLKISTPKQCQIFKHVAVGEVWLCSGQSNMQFVLEKAANSTVTISKADYPNIRLFNMKGRWETNASEWPQAAIDSVNHLLYFKDTNWEPCTPTSAKAFSAVAYHFGKILQDSLQVPIGLICNAVGGATTESWIDRYSLESKFPAILTNWTQNDFIQDWARERALLNLKKSNSFFKRHPYEPCYLYESGILPLQQYPIKGVIWYQGESNAHNYATHEILFKLLVDSWRKNWNNPKMPFYYVQLSSLNRPSWPWFRDSQRKLMNEIPHTGMVVSSDKGDSLDVHPIYKQDIGIRLAKWALNQCYHYKIVPSGPLYKSIHKDKNSLIIGFDYAPNGLQISQGNKIIGFEIAEQEGIYYPAQAMIINNSVKVWSNKVKNPRYIRYGWKPFTRANLINKEGLPASTFKTKLE